MNGINNVQLEINFLNGTDPHYSGGEQQLKSIILKQVNAMPLPHFPFGRRKRNGHMVEEPQKGQKDSRRFIMVRVPGENWKYGDKPVKDMYLDMEVVENTVYVNEGTAVHA
jgi:hypothetical protein